VEKCTSGKSEKKSDGLTDICSKYRKAVLSYLEDLVVVCDEGGFDSWVRGLSLGRKSGGFVDVRYWGIVCGDEAMGWVEKGEGRRERGEGRGEE